MILRSTRNRKKIIIGRQSKRTRVLLNDESRSFIIKEDNGDISVFMKRLGAAFDSNIIDITPDYKIIVREDILSEKDGPMLRHGIQQLHDQKIILPKSKLLWPDQNRLEVRYNRFREEWDRGKETIKRK